MAVRADANSEYLSRTTGGFLNFGSPFTISMWIHLITDRNASGCAWAQAIVSTVDYLVFYNENSDGTTFLWEYADDGGSTQAGSFVMSLSTWYFVAYARSGTGTNQAAAYRRVASATSLTVSTHTNARTGWTATSEYILTNPFNTTSGWFAGRTANVKTWAAALTEAEILNESHQFRPRRTENLHAWYPMVERTTGGSAIDQGGAARTLTVTGSLTIEDGPPIPWSMTPRRRWYPLAAAAPSVRPPMPTRAVLQAASRAASY